MCVCNILAICISYLKYHRPAEHNIDITAPPCNSKFYHYNMCTNEKPRFIMVLYILKGIKVRAHSALQTALLCVVYRQIAILQTSLFLQTIYYSLI